MILHAGILIVISLVFAVLEISNISSYSSRSMRLFKLLLSISLGLLTSFIVIEAYDQAFNEYKEWYKNILVFPCTIIVFIGFEMLIYGKMGNHEYK